MGAGDIKFLKSHDVINSIFGNIKKVFKGFAFTQTIIYFFLKSKKILGHAHKYEAVLWALEILRKTISYYK